MGSAQLVMGPPGANALQLNLSFAPEPGSVGFVVVGLVGLLVWGGASVGGLG